MKGPNFRFPGLASSGLDPYFFVFTAAQWPYETHDPYAWPWSVSATSAR